VLVNLYETEAEKADRFHASRFQFDRASDSCICPRGEKLKFAGFRRNRQGCKERRYVCQKWGECPEARQCSRDRRGRHVPIGPYREAVDEQRARQRQEHEKKKLRRRKVVVEPVFAHIKANWGFRRWSFWGLGAAQSQWSMLCTTYNLKKLLALWQRGELKLAT
jgi:hypothetical protein